MLIQGAQEIPLQLQQVCNIICVYSVHECMWTMLQIMW